MQAYSDPAREDDPYALPDVEVFWHDARDTELGDCFSAEYHDGEALASGWYYWYCFPGCLPDSDPLGPFRTEEEALADAREDAANSAE